MIAQTTREKLMPFLENTFVRWGMALAWTAWITIILIQPEATPLIDIGLRPEPPTLERETVFTILHITAFVLMTALWWWALAQRWPIRRAIVWAFVFAVIMGGFTEAMQGFAPDRHPNLPDFLSNVIGALLVLNVVWRRSRPEQINPHEKGRV